jgi:putative ABC transport system ATP-binding protein
LLLVCGFSQEATSNEQPAPEPVTGICEEPASYAGPQTTSNQQLSEGETMLEMRNIKKIYRTDTIETHALADFSLLVEDGEFVAVMGPSGSGKTTFLNVAGLLDTFDSGSYVLDGQDVSRLSDAQMSRIRNRAIGFIFQSFNLIPDLNVFDNVDVPLRYRGLGAADRKELLDRINGTGTTIVMVTHSPECAVRAQRQIHVLDGRVVDLGAPRVTLANANHVSAGIASTLG